MVEGRTNCIEESMQNVEKNLKDTLYRVEVIEKKLKTKLLTVEKREKLEDELEQVKKVLKRKEEDLQSLRKENSKSFMVAACLVFVCFLLYGVYLMITGNTQ